MHKWGTYILFHINVIFVQDSKLVVDERNQSFCLGQITLKSLQEFQALTKLHQCLGGLFQPKHTHTNKTTMCHTSFGRMHISSSKASPCLFPPLLTPMTKEIMIFSSFYLNSPCCHLAYYFIKRDTVSWLGFCVFCTSFLFFVLGVHRGGTQRLIGPPQMAAAPASHTPIADIWSSAPAQNRSSLHSLQDCFCLYLWYTTVSATICNSLLIWILVLLWN